MATFVDSVQNGVSSLRSVTNGETYLPTLCLIIEEKLEEDVQRAYYRELAKEGEKSTYKLLLNFLSREKDAANLRKSTNSTSEKTKDEDNSENTISNSSVVGNNKKMILKSNRKV